MEKFDEIQLKALLLRREKMQAIQLLMQQTNMDLREAKNYIDDFYLRENIHSDHSEVSYSAIMENGVSIYYRHENGNKYVISKEEAPSFLVNRVESPSGFQGNIHTQKNYLPNHRKGRKILVHLSVPFLALCLFFLYKLCTTHELTFNNIGGLIASGGMALILYLILFFFWLDEHIVKERKREADEMEIPAEFAIKGKISKSVFVFELIYLFTVSGIWLWFSIGLFQGKRFLYGVLTLVFFAFFSILHFPDTIRDCQRSRLSLHIHGQTIRVCKGREEISVMQTANIKCEFFSGHRTFEKSRRRHRRLYPKAILTNSTGELIAEIFLDLPEYHLLKIYMIQQGVIITDSYDCY